MKRWDVLVLGGGPAGMMAAGQAAQRGFRVLLVDGNPRLGAKLRITGGGRCNLTHEGDVNALLAAFPKAQSRFLKAPFHAFDGEAVRLFFSEKSIPTEAESDGRVFPVAMPDGALRITKAMGHWLENCGLENSRLENGGSKDGGVELKLGTRAIGLEGAVPRVEALRLADGSRLEVHAIILATGGASWSRTGSRGEILSWFQSLDIPVVPWAPALAPIPLVHARPAWEGVSLRNGCLRLLEGPHGRRVADFSGDVVFTRTGLSGPAALALSERVDRARREGGAWLVWAFVDHPHDTLERAWLDEAQSQPQASVQGWLRRWMPERLAQSVMDDLGLARDARMVGLSKPSRRAVVERVAAFPLGEPGNVSLEKGEVSVGGVALGAVDPHTMKLRGWDNLYACGELLDVNGPVGGYNLQAAFSTGFVAGRSVLP